MFDIYIIFDFRLDRQAENQRPTEETKEDVKLGPYVFASCYPDIACYLQREIICLCQTGEAPQVFKNPYAGADPKFRARARCVVESLPMQVCNHNICMCSCVCVHVCVYVRAWVCLCVQVCM